MSKVITITDLDNLPTGVTLTVNNATRSGNSFSCTNQRLGVIIKYSDTSEVQFKSGDKVILMMTVNAFTPWLRVYARGVNNAGSHVTGLMVWSSVSGMEGWIDPIIGEDANNGVGTTRGTVVLEVTFIDDSYGFYFSIGSVRQSDGAAASGTGTFDFTAIKAGSDDPYGPGGNSEESDSAGTFDDESDPINDSPIPTRSMAETGFTRIFNPDVSELRALARYMWTDTTFLQTVINHLKQLLESPIDAVISLALLPCAIPNSSAVEVNVMYIPTGVYMKPATTQFVDVDCGTLDIEEYYGSALDYSPYTEIVCYLPYIGQVSLDTDEVMGKTLQVKYRIDIVTGMCVAKIFVNGNVLYQFSGHCAINMPISSADFSTYIGAAIQAAKMVGGLAAGAAGFPGVAAGLIGAPEPHTSITTTDTKNTTRNPSTGRQIVSGTSSKTTTKESSGASFGELSTKAASNTVNSVMSSKLHVEHAGGFTGNSGFLGVRRPYVIIKRPRMCNPEEYGTYNGYPSMIYLNLGSCSGYTEVQSIQLTGIDATNPEMAEIAELLKSGVIL